MIDASAVDDDVRRILAAADALFDEFHSPSTSNERKGVIEIQLKSLLGDSRHWRIWTDCLLLTRSQYVVWFCLNCLNDFISNFWTTWASGEQKDYIKQRLLWYMSTKQVLASFPSFILTKLLKVFVDIGRSDWPEKYPDFLTHIETFVKDIELRSTGLRMLRLVSEEFISSKMDMSQSRKNVLKSNLCQRVPAWMEIIYSLIQPVVEVVSVSSQQMPSGDNFTAALRDTSDALHLLTHVFSWLPGNVLVPRPLLDSLFRLASCDASEASLSDLATSSLSTVAELAGRACMSPDMEKTLWVIYEFAYVRLDTVTAQLTNEEMSDESDASFEYYQQFVELIRSLIISHLQRFEHHKDFPTMNFLEKFFRFTFSISVLDLFLSCVDIWNDFLDRILALASARTSAARQVIIQSYTAPILALVDHLLLRVQFQHNTDQLDELFPEIASQTLGLTEREDFFQRCVNVVIKAGEILPSDVLQKLSQRYSQLQQGFQQLLTLIQRVNSGQLMLNVVETKKRKEAHCLIRDLGIITRTLATHCGFLTGDLFLNFYDQVAAFLQHFLQSFQVLTSSLLPSGSHHNTPAGHLEEDLESLLIYAYQSVEGIFPWIVQLYHQEAGDNSQNSAILASLMDTALRPVMGHFTPAVMLASSKVLCTITKTIRSSEMMSVSAVVELCRQLTGPSSNSTQAFFSLPLAVQVNLASALSNILTLPHSSKGHVTTVEENKNWDERADQHAQLMQTLTGRVDSLQETLSIKETEVLKETLGLVDGLLLNTTEDPKKSKQIMLASLMPFLKTLARRPERTQILQTVYNLFSSLKSAFPPELSSPLSDLFEKLFEQFLDPEELLKALRSNDAVQVEALSTCFDLLKLVVSDTAYKSYLPMVLILCHIVCPALNSLTDIRVDFRTASYELLLSVLMHHWTYFFKSVRMVAATNGDNIETTTEEQSESKDFLVIMQCLGGALLQPEISATQVVLEGLNQLHRTRQIFDKTPFQQALRNDFLNALLRLLVHKEKQLLSEDMYLAVYNIASSDFSYFRDQYLPGLVGQWLAGSDVSWQRRLLDGFSNKEDQNGFVEQLQNLVIEVRCYLLHKANIVSTSSVTL